jgi:hypothetical protein
VVTLWLVVGIFAEDEGVVPGKIGVMLHANTTALHSLNYK